MKRAIVWSKPFNPKWGALYLLLVAVAAGGNFAAVSLFPGFDVLFGPIAVLLIVVTFGVGAGTVAAFAAALVTIHLWGHPYALSWYTLEALVVGAAWYALKPDHRNLVVLDALYWPLVGGPLILLLFPAGTGTLQAAGLVALKSWATGILDALVAQLILSIIPVREERGSPLRLPQVGVRRMMFNILMAVFTIPVFILGAAYGNVRQRDLQNQILESIADVRYVAEKQIHAIVGGYRQAVTALILSNKAATSGLPQIPPAFLQANQWLRDLSTMDSTDLLPEHEAVPLSEDGRPFLLLPIVERGNAYLARVTPDDLYTYAEQLSRRYNVKLTLLDATDRVFFSIRSDLASGDPYVPPFQGIEKEAGRGVTQRIPSGPSGQAYLERWSRSEYVARSSLLPSFAGTMILEADFSAYVGQLYRFFYGIMAMIVLLSLVAVATALAVSRLLGAPLVRLAQLTSEVPHRFMAGHSEIWPRSAVREIEELSENAHLMETQLARQFQELSNAKDTLESRVAERTQELERANNARRDFLANMSHEIRNPLNGVIGMMRLLERTELSPAQRRYLEAMSGSADFLSRLLQDVLDMSRLERGRLSASWRPVDLRRLFEELRAQNQPVAEQRGLYLRWELGSEVPPVIRTDELRLRQILQNLIGNGLKYTEEGGVTVTASIRDGKLSLAVSDSGPGISPEQQERVFESFSQGDSSITKRHPGTGLGLAIVRGLTELLRGEIELESTPGEGSTFRLTLPLLIPDETEIAAARREEDETAHPKAGVTEEALREASRIEGATQDTAAGSEASRQPTLPGLQEEGRKRILVAEDDAINRLYLESLCKSRGWEVIGAPNGKVATERAQNHRFDLILMDLQMPVTDGLSATRAIRNLPKGNEVPIIAITAYASGADRERCLEAGMNDVLTKPLDEAEFHRTLSAYLET